MEDTNFSMCKCTGCLKGETSNYYYYYYYNQYWIKNKMHHFVVRCFRMNGITQTQVPAVRKKYISNLYPSSESGLPHYTFLPANCRSSEMQYHIHTFCLCELLPPILNLNFKKLLEMLKDVNNKVLKTRHLVWSRYSVILMKSFVHRGSNNFSNKTCNLGK